MFKYSFIFIILVLSWLAIVVVVLRLQQAWAVALRPRLVTLLGCVVAFGAYFSQAWLEFDIIGYIEIFPLEDMLGLISEGLFALIIEKLGIEWGPKILQLLSDFTQLNGWKIQAVPTYPLATRACTLMPPVLAFAALLWVPMGVWLRGKRFAVFVGWLMIALNVLGSVSLLLALPSLDALGMAGHFRGMLFSAFLGARIGNGPWLAIIGMLLIAMGGAVEIMDRPDVEDLSSSFESEEI